MMAVPMCVLFTRYNLKSEQSQTVGINKINL